MRIIMARCMVHSIDVLATIAIEVEEDLPIACAYSPRLTIDLSTLGQRK